MMGQEPDNRHGYCNRAHRVRIAWGCMLAAMALLAACTRHGQEGYARYRTNCGICHHGGEGLKGEIPPITGRVDRIATSPEGRQYSCMCC